VDRARRKAYPCSSDSEPREEASRSNAEAAKDAEERRYFLAAFAAFAFQGGVS
jgi:hypothetical protein